MSLLDDARQKINEIDKEMAALFEERMRAVEDVIHYKQENDLPVLDNGREQAILEKNVLYIEHDKYKESYVTFMKDLMNTSKQYQRSIIHKERVGYQGVEGAFSYLASQQCFPDYQKKNFATFEDVFKAVCNNEIVYGVIPFENSYTGEVGEVLDLLMQYDVYIEQLYDLKISQNLLGIKGATLQDIKQVYSKDQAIYQSKQFLEGRGYELVPYSNTALAAEFVAKENDKSKAAIAAKENADLYGLEILAEDINTSNQNTTRFIVISKKLKQEGNQFALAFSVPHKAGALLAAMNSIARQEYNMQNIRSRSLKDRPWEYYFFVEIEGDLSSDKAQKMLSELQSVCEKVKILGSYKKESRDEK